MADITNQEPVVQSWLMARAEIAKWKEVEASCVEKLKDALGDAQTGEVNGKTVVSWKWSKPAETLDVKRLEAELPASILDPYRRIQAASRPFKPVD